MVGRGEHVGEGAWCEHGEEEERRGVKEIAGEEEEGQERPGGEVVTINILQEYGEHPVLRREASGRCTNCMKAHRLGEEEHRACGREMRPHDQSERRPHDRRARKLH